MLAVVTTAGCSVVNCSWLCYWLLVWLCCLLALAVGEGWLEGLQYLLATNCDLSDKLTRLACRFGIIDCLKLLKEHGCPWNEKACARAAHGWKLDCLMFAHINGCPWDARTMGSKDIKCLRYAHSQGCPWGNALAKASELQKRQRMILNPDPNEEPIEQLRREVQIQLTTAGCCLSRYLSAELVSKILKGVYPNVFQ